MAFVSTIQRIAIHPTSAIRRQYNSAVVVWPYSPQRSDDGGNKGRRWRHPRRSPHTPTRQRPPPFVDTFHIGSPSRCASWTHVAFGAPSHRTAPRARALRRPLLTPRAQLPRAVATLALCVIRVRALAPGLHLTCDAHGDGVRDGGFSPEHGRALKPRVAPPLHPHAPQPPHPPARGRT